MLCPSKAELVDCLLGKLPDARTQLLWDHAATCETCSQVMDQADDTADGLVASLRVENPSSMESSLQCDRMIQRAEQLVPPNPLEEKPIEPKSHLLEGTRVRDYEIVRPIGEGGMGAVFLARHVRLKRNVAVKVLSLGRQRNAEAQQRFEQEMQIVGQLQHPGIVQALDAGEDHGIQYLVMEVIDGADLRRIVRLLGPLALAEACEITYQAAKALAYAHSQNLIHRDVKPSNIMLAGGGVVKVMDLGIARFADQQHALTSTQQALGSLDFMAPEQLQAQGVDGRADIYALGCTLHFLLTGEPPERRRTASLLVSKAPMLEALRHTLPPPITHLMQQMLLPKPSERCETMDDVAERIKPFCGSADLVQLSTKASTLVSQEDRGESVSLTSEVPIESPPPRRRWLGVVAAVCAVCLLVSWIWYPSSGRDTSTSTGLAARRSISSNVESVREIPLFQIHKAAIRSAAFCDSTSQLIVSSDDNSISIRDLPNQRKICCLFANDVPVVRLSVANNSDRFVALDAHGNISAFDLPSGSFAWSVVPRENEPRAIDLSIDINDNIAVLLEQGEGRWLHLADGSVKAKIDEAKVENESAIYWRHRAEAEEAAMALKVDPEEIERAREFGVESAWVVSRDRLARIVHLLDSESPHFVYAEHESPITTLLTFESNAMVLTADASGQIRLWQAPETRYSDMLLGCETKIDSMEMTFALRRNRWTSEAFAASPDQVQLNDHAGTMRLETSIQRDGQSHTLQYKIIDTTTAP